jgi:glycosyltransferase involved in cell wall biosynthesis
LALLPEEIAYFTDARGWGGAEVHLTQLMLVARRHGVVPRVFCADRREARAWLEELECLGFGVVRYRPTKEYNPLGILVAWRHLRGFELVHVNKTSPRNSLPAIVASRLCGARVVLATEHVTAPIESHFPFGERIITFLVRSVNRLVDTTIAVSALSREMLMRNYGIPESRLVVIRNGIDASRFDVESDGQDLRSELGLSPDDQVALLVGRFSAGKGHDLALSALARLSTEGSREVKMVFAGEGGKEGEIRALAEETGVESRVVFAGFRRDIPRLLSAANVLILPSESESMPLVILEAMSARRPVVATDVGGIREMVDDGRTGLLIQPGDVEGLSRALAELASDPERARAMGEAGRKKVEEEFGEEACVSAVLRLYGDLLETKRKVH